MKQSFINRFQYDIEGIDYKMVYDCSAFTNKKEMVDFLNQKQFVPMQIVSVFTRGDEINVVHCKKVEMPASIDITRK